jgi:hypothetical protein
MRFRLEKLLGKKTKKVKDIWCKRLIVAGIKGSYNIWMKKCGYTDITLNIDRQHDPNIQVDRLEVFNNGSIDEKWIDERTQATQESLVKDEELKEKNINMEEGNEIDINTFNIEEEPPSLIQDHEAEEL